MRAISKEKTISIAFNSDLKAVRVQQQFENFVPFGEKQFKELRIKFDRPHCFETTLTPSFHICTFKSQEDTFISKSLVETGIFLPQLTSTLKLSLDLSGPSTLFLDLG